MSMADQMYSRHESFSYSRQDSFFKRCDAEPGGRCANASAVSRPSGSSALLDGQQAEFLERPNSVSFRRARDVVGVSPHHEVGRPTKGPHIERSASDPSHRYAQGMTSRFVASSTVAGESLSSALESVPEHQIAFRPGA